MAIIDWCRNVMTTGLISIFVCSLKSQAQSETSFLPSSSMTLDFSSSWRPLRTGYHSSNYLWPSSRPIFSNNTQESPEDVQPRPPSPARQCRTSGACRGAYHGTALPNSWKIHKSTTPTTTTQLINSATTPSMFMIVATNSTTIDANPTLTSIAVPYTTLLGPILPEVTVEAIATISSTTPTPSMTIKEENFARSHSMSTNELTEIVATSITPSN